MINKFLKKLAQMGLPQSTEKQEQLGQPLPARTPVTTPAPQVTPEKVNTRQQMKTDVPVVPDINQSNIKGLVKEWVIGNYPNTASSFPKEYLAAGGDMELRNLVDIIVKGTISSQGLDPASGEDNADIQVIKDKAWGWVEQVLGGRSSQGVSTDPQQAVGDLPTSEDIYEDTEEVQRSESQTNFSKTMSFMDRDFDPHGLGKTYQEFLEQDPEYIKKFEREFIDGIRDKDSTRDYRLNILKEKPIYDLLNDESFQKRMVKFLSDPNVEQRLKNVTGLSVKNPVQIPGAFDTIEGTGSRERQNEFLNTFIPLLEPSQPGAGDGVFDVITKELTSGDIPDALANYLKSGLNISKKRQIGSTYKDQSTDSSPYGAGEDSLGSGIDAGDAKADMLEQQSQAAQAKELSERSDQYEELRDKVEQLSEPISNFSNDVIQGFYGYFDQLEQYNAGNEDGLKKIKDIQKIPLKNRKSQEIGELNMADIMSAVIPGAIDQWTSLIDNGDMKLTDRQKARFTSSAGGFSIEDKGGSEFDFDVSKLGGSGGVAPYIRELGLVKSRIHELKKQGKNPEDILAVVSDENKNSARQINIHQGLIRSTLRENPELGKTLVQMALDSSHDSDSKSPIVKLMQSFKLKLPKTLSPFMDGVVKRQEAAQGGDTSQASQARRMWMQIIGPHSKSGINPVSEGEFEQLEKIENWWEKEVSELAELMYPGDKMNPKEKMKFFSGMLNAPTELSIMVHELLTDKEMPDRMKKYLDWMKKQKKAKPHTTQLNKPGFPEYDPEHRLDINANAVHRMMVYAFFDHEKKIAVLKSYRNNLSKVASTDAVDVQIESEKESLKESLRRLSHLL